jgi:dienelactone hydrolase
VAGDRPEHPGREVVLDWIIANRDVLISKMVAGGFSMGGDISIALAGIDHRVGRVAAIGSTPDWTPRCVPLGRQQMRPR